MNLGIFEHSLCGPSYVCGPEPDKVLFELQNVIQMLAKLMKKPECCTISQSPVAFVNNPVIKDFIQTQGPAKLPATLLDCKII